MYIDFNKFHIKPFIAAFSLIGELVLENFGDNCTAGLIMAWTQTFTVSFEVTDVLSQASLGVLM